MHVIPKAKGTRYLDILMKEKEKIPSPDKYAHQRDQFNDKKPGKILAFDRSLYLDRLQKESAAILASPAKYNKFEFDEKKNKPPRGFSNVKQEKYTVT